MSKNNKFLITSIFLSMMFFCVSVGAMKDDVKETRQENSDKSKIVLKNFVDDENKESVNLKNETNENNKNEIKEKIKKIDGVVKEFKYDDFDDLKIKDKITKNEVLNQKVEKNTYDNNKEDINKIKDRYEEKIYIRRFKTELKAINTVDREKLKKVFFNILENKKGKEECLEDVECLFFIKNDIDKIDRGEGNYFKKFIKYLYLSLEEGILTENIDKIIDSIKDLKDFDLFIKKIKEYLDNKFMLLEKIDQIALNLTSINNNNEMQRNADILLCETEGYINENNHEKLKYYLFGKDGKDIKNINKRFIYNILKLVNEYKLTFFEKLENLLQNFDEIEKEEELKSILLNLKDEGLIQEDVKKILKEAGEYIDKDSFNKFSYLLEPVEKNINNNSRKNIIHLAENNKSKFLEELKKMIEKEYDEKIFMNEIKIVLNKLISYFDEYNIVDKEKFEEAYNHLIKILKGKFDIERRREQLEILFHSFSGEKLKKFIEKIIKIAEKKGKSKFLIKFEKLIFKECTKPNEKELIEEIQKILSDMKDNLKDKIVLENNLVKLKEESAKKYYENMNKLSKILLESGVQYEEIEKMREILYKSEFYQMVDFINRCIIFTKRNNVNFLTIVGILIDNEKERRELEKEVDSALKLSGNGKLSEDEQKKIQHNVKILYMLYNHPLISDAKYNDFYDNIDDLLLKSNLMLKVVMIKDDKSSKRYKFECVLQSVDETDTD